MLDIVAVHPRGRDAEGSETDLAEGLPAIEPADDHPGLVSHPSDLGVAFANPPDDAAIVAIPALPDEVWVTQVLLGMAGGPDLFVAELPVTGVGPTGERIEDGKGVRGTGSIRDRGRCGFVDDVAQAPGLKLSPRRANGWTDRG